jgi:protein TonB
LIDEGDAMNDVNLQLPLPARAAASSSDAVVWGGVSQNLGNIVLLQCATMAMWLGCLVVGIWGVTLHYPRELLPPEDSAAVTAQTIRADLTPPPPQMQAPPAPKAPEKPAPQPPPVAEVALPPQAPPLVSVAAPDSKVAFALPVEGPARVVAPIYAVPIAPPAKPPPEVRHLTFGVGEGRQPDPDYPAVAQQAGQQGDVTVKFTVGEDGSIIAAEVTKPSRWPILNQAALLGIRNTWHYPRGTVRTYDIVIQYRLRDQ